MYTNGSIPDGWYEAEVLEVESLGIYGIRSGVNIKFLLPEVEQQVTYYIPPGENGYFARKNATYYLGYTYLSKELYRLELLIGKFVRMKIRSSKDEDGIPYVRVKGFAFSPLMFFPPSQSTEELRASSEAGATR